MDNKLLKQLSRLAGSKTLIVGIGNTLKSDDGAGPLVCEKLQRSKITADIIDAGSAPENYIQPVVKKAPQDLLVIDAIDSGASAGTISIFKPEQLSSIIVSTHTLSPRLFTDMVCQQIDVQVFFIGIQPKHVQLGREVSREVNNAIRELADTLTGIFAVR